MQKSTHISTPLNTPYPFKMTMLTKREKSHTKAQNLPSQRPLAGAVKLLSYAAPLRPAPPQGPTATTTVTVNADMTSRGGRPSWKTPLPVTIQQADSYLCTSVAQETPSTNIASITFKKFWTGQSNQRRPPCQVTSS